MDNDGGQSKKKGLMILQHSRNGDHSDDSYKQQVNVDDDDSENLENVRESIIA